MADEPETRNFGTWRNLDAAGVERVTRDMVDRLDADEVGLTVGLAGADPTDLRVMVGIPQAGVMLDLAPVTAEDLSRRLALLSAVARRASAGGDLDALLREYERDTGG